MNLDEFHSFARDMINAFWPDEDVSDGDIDEVFFAHDVDEWGTIDSDELVPVLKEIIDHVAMSYE